MTNNIRLFTKDIIHNITAYKPIAKIEQLERNGYSFSFCSDYREIMLYLGNYKPVDEDDLEDAEYDDDEDPDALDRKIDSENRRLMKKAEKEADKLIAQRFANGLPDGYILDEGYGLYANPLYISLYHPIAQNEHGRWIQDKEVLYDKADKEALHAFAVANKGKFFSARRTEINDEWIYSEFELLDP